MMEERLPNICFSDHGVETHVLHTGDKAGASYRAFCFLPMDKVQPHCLISHTGQAVPGMSFAWLFQHIPISSEEPA